MMVLKTDGTLWLCTDFHKLNAIMQFDAFLMPQIRELLERTGQAKFISIFDLLKGHWQSPLRPEDHANTAFGTA